jgi:hypothetical protein
LRVYRACPSDVMPSQAAMWLSNTISGSFHVKTKGGSQDPGNVSLMTVTFCGVLDRGHAGSLVLPQTRPGQQSHLVTANPTVTLTIPRVLLGASSWAQASRGHSRGEACKAGDMAWHKTNQGQTRQDRTRPMGIFRWPFPTPQVAISQTGKRARVLASDAKTPRPGLLVLCDTREEMDVWGWLLCCRYCLRHAHSAMLNRQRLRGRKFTDFLL